MKKLLFIAFALLAISSAKAQDIDTIYKYKPYEEPVAAKLPANVYNRIINELKTTTKFAVDFEYDKGVYWGLSFDEFITYYSSRYVKKDETKSEESLNANAEKVTKLLLKRWENALFKQVPKYTFTRNNTDETNFKLHFRINELTENAGMKAIAYLTYKDSVTLHYCDLSIEDNRWNDYDVLLLEQAEEQSKTLRKFLEKLKRWDYYFSTGWRSESNALLKNADVKQREY